MSDSEGDIGTPRHRREASSPERTPGRSPEGHVANLVQEAEERSQRRAAAIRNVLESIRIAPPLPRQQEASSSASSSQELSIQEEPRAAPQAVAGPESSQRQTRLGMLGRLDAEARPARATCQDLASLQGLAASREAELSRAAKECERRRSEKGEGVAKEAKPERTDTSALHTEWRGRIRAAEQAQKKLQRLMDEEVEARAAEREQHTEETVELRLRASRSKEASERYVERIQQAEAEACNAAASARHFEEEAEQSRAELGRLRASCQLQLQSEQVKVEAQKSLQKALKEQVQDLCEKTGSELEEKTRQLRESEDTVRMLRAELAKQVEECAKLKEASTRSVALLHIAEASRNAEEEAAQQKQKLKEELVDLHQNYANRLNALRAQHGGERRAFEAVEDELRQLYSQECLVSQRNQETWAEATEAALAGEAAEARLARAMEAESSAEVQRGIEEQLLLLKRHLSAEVPPGLHPRAHELFMDLCSAMQDALCNEVLRNPCSDLRRSLCRDLKQQLRDQLRSEVMSASREASTGSTTGSSRRQRTPRTTSAVRQELTRRGAVLMDAFAAAAEEAQMRQDGRI